MHSNISVREDLELLLVREELELELCSQIMSTIYSLCVQINEYNLLFKCTN